MRGAAGGKKKRWYSRHRRQTERRAARSSSSGTPLIQATSPAMLERSNSTLVGCWRELQAGACTTRWAKLS